MCQSSKLARKEPALNTTTIPAGTTPRTWLCFTHGIAATVPVLLTDPGDVIYVPEQRADRQIAERAHVCGSVSGPIREAAFNLVPLPLGRETPLPDNVTSSADAYA